MVRAVAERAPSPRQGYTVITAADGEQGWKRLAASAMSTC